MTGELRKYVPPAYFRSDIPVTNWGNAFSFATAEGAIALLFSVLKDTKGLDLQVREKGSVIGDTPHICSLHGARVGIYGLSSIGRIVAERILPYGAEVLFYDPTITDVPPGLKRCGSLRDLFAGSDVVSIHTGLNDVTRHSVNGELLSLLPDGGILINTARGGIVVEEDLARILHTGRLRAGLDVIQHEDDWRTSLFVTTPNTVLTGHSMAYIGRAETTTLQSVAMDNIGRFAAGQALKHIVTEERFRLMT
jgi:phosphoglycerate dehydrogenase-like enzyme